MYSINGLRGHLAEDGIVGAKESTPPKKLAAPVTGGAADSPAVEPELVDPQLAHSRATDERIDELRRLSRTEGRRYEAGCRVMTIPGIYLICAVALAALAPVIESLSEGRDLIA